MIETVTLFLAEAGPSWSEQISLFFKEAGVFMFLLALTSVAALTAILFKFLSLTQNRVIPEDLAEKVERFEETVANGGAEPVLAEFERGQSALARLCSIAVGQRGRPQSEIAEAVQATARQEIVNLQAGMTVIDVVVAVAPLLGLLGTASGLVVIFSGFEADANRLTIALGIGRALKTTIVGLAIAVPSIIAHGYFQRRIDTLAVRLEVLLTKLAHVCERTARPDNGSPVLSPKG
ncbi:MotA/TolQ/ExbB proton channel family protein [Haloferula sp.]|uniref:MotA/TolQ/ExbB proton channel family protein n=1 Tax=Haloferula sp. TaxID=2497595 RepID=UPI00329D6586